MLTGSLSNWRRTVPGKHHTNEECAQEMSREWRMLDVLAEFGIDP